MKRREDSKRANSAQRPARTKASGARPVAMAALSRAPKKVGSVAETAGVRSPEGLERDLLAAQARIKELENRLAGVTDRIAWITDRLHSLLDTEK